MIRNLLIVIAAIGAAASTAAAHPSSYGYDDHGQHFSYPTSQFEGSAFRDDYRPWRGQQRHQRQFVLLADAQRVSDDYERRAFVAIDPSVSRVRTLRLDAVGDAMYVTQVAIELVGGQTLKIQPRTTLSGREPLTIELGAPRDINRVIVYGRNYSNASAFTVAGR